ncbi:MAG: TlpA family protein disulfide reductase [Clostridia bacterium]|nr:TlpA family protein disulfide reductase [Clostridia bacterium]
MKKAGNVIFWAVVVGTVLTALYTFYNKSKQDTEAKQAPRMQQTRTVQEPHQEGPQVPDFELKDINGDSVKLSDYRGKVVVINFWTTWCRYCIEEMPDFNELGGEFEKAGDAVVLAVNVQEGADVVKSFLKKKELPFLKILLDETGEVAVSYGVSGYPNTYIVDKNGKLYKYIPGKTNKKTVLDFVNEIRR